jgi:hypothetical protein
MDSGKPQGNTIEVKMAVFWVVAPPSSGSLDDGGSKDL